MTESFKKGLGQKTKGSKKKDNASQEAKPVRAKNSFIVFCDEKRPIIKQQNPGITPAETTKKISELWKLLSKEEKDVYKEKAKSLKAGSEKLSIMRHSGEQLGRIFN